MRWSIIRLIWFRELRDQLRDRRTLFTILLLPLLLYPLISLLVMQFASQLLDQKSKIAFISAKPAQETFPEPGADGAYSLLAEKGQIPDKFLQSPKEPLGIFSGKIALDFEFLSPDRAEQALKDKTVDLLVSAPPDFMAQLSKGEQPQLLVRGRPGDDRSRRAFEQFSILLLRWESHLKDVRFQQKGLPSQFGDPFVVNNPSIPAEPEVMATESLLNMLIRTFPFMLVMWSLAGALYPAVDLCAGEKERGTMETLLISPAGREEIVYGKFLTIWVFSAVTAIMHLVSMSIATWQMRSYLPQGAVTVPAMLWSVVLVLPLSAFFSAVSLSVGAYARSSKEGQYYLMPLFWISMPLVFLTMAPGVELNAFYSMVPVTGVALLMQQLMMAPSLDQVPWFYFLPVFATVILYSWLALRWAIWQFQREEVLFREAERLDIKLWLQRLFREKETFPSVGQAVFCFLLMLGLRWLSVDLGMSLHFLERSVIIQLAFVAAPPSIMALILTTRPRQSLSLTPPRLAFLLVPLLLLPLAELAHFLMNQSPALYRLLEDRRSFVVAAYQQLGDSLQHNWVIYFLMLGVLPAVCKELAFRGFILNGLRRRLPPWPAILLSSFLFAAFHTNVFALIPLFLLGIALGWLTVRSGSVFPAMILHTGCNLLVLGRPPVLSPQPGETWEVSTVLPLLVPLTIISTALAGYLLWRLNGSEHSSGEALSDSPGKKLA